MINNKITKANVVCVDTEGGDTVLSIPGVDGGEELRNVHQLIEIGAIKVQADMSVKDIYELSQRMFPNGKDRVTKDTPVVTMTGPGGKLFSARCRPITDIPPDSSACHGYRYEDLKDYPTHEESDIIGQFDREFDGNFWIVQNPDYDYPVIRWHADLYQKARCEPLIVRCEPLIVFDTVRLARKLLTGKCPNLKLGTMMHYFKCPRMQWHLAFPDAVTLAMIFKNLLDLYIDEGGEDSLFALARYIYCPAIQENMLFGKMRGEPVSKVDDGYLLWYFHPKQRQGYSGYRNLDMEYTMAFEVLKRGIGDASYHENMMEQIVIEYYSSMIFPIGFDPKILAEDFMKETERLLASCRR